MWFIGSVLATFLVPLLVVVLHRKPSATPTTHSSALHDALFCWGTRLARHLLRAGVSIGPMVLLTVRGRKTGLPRTTPVDLFESDGRSFLVSTHGDGSSNWVRNLRAEGKGTITRGRRQQTITAVELAPEAAGSILKDVLGPRLASPMRGFVLRRTLVITPDASLEDFIGASRLHPVFELAFPDQSDAI